MVDIGKILDPAHYNQVLQQRWEQFFDDYSHAPNKPYFISEYKTGLDREIQKLSYQWGISQLIPEIQNKLEKDDRVTAQDLLKRYCIDNGKKFGLLARQIAEIKALEEHYRRVINEFLKRRNAQVTAEPAIEQIGSREEFIPESTKKQILIKDEFIPSIVAVLKDYFPSSTTELLTTALKGEALTSKLVFHSNANKLTHAFWELSQPTAAIVLSPKIDLVNWICSTFQYSKKKAIKDFNWESVRRSIMTQNSKCADPILAIKELINSHNNNR